MEGTEQILDRVNRNYLLMVVGYRKKKSRVMQNLGLYSWVHLSKRGR